MDCGSPETSTKDITITVSRGLFSVSADYHCTDYSRRMHFVFIRTFLLHHHILLNVNKWQAASVNIELYLAYYARKIRVCDRYDSGFDLRERAVGSK